VDVNASVVIIGTGIVGCSLADHLTRWGCQNVVVLEQGPDDVRWWNTRIAPMIAFVSQAFVLYLLLSQIQFFGAEYGLAKWLAPIVLVIFLLGLGGAFYLKAKDPAKYEKIGHLIYEGA
jgi:siroheme synthase (precorrin-2 oxidase/ferrochelatase)